MDPYHAALDHGDVGISDLRHFSGRPLGLLRAGMGWLLGVGSCRERFADAVAHRHRLPAFGDDAGKAWDVEDVEHLAGLRHVLASHSRNFPHAQRHHQFGSRLRTVAHRKLVRMVPCDQPDRVHRFFLPEQIAIAQRTQARVAGVARVEFPVQ